MRTLLNEIRKHVYIYFLFVKFSLMSQLEYRANFIGNFSMEGGYFLAKLSYIAVIYRSGVKINGLSPDELLFFIGTFIFMTSFYAGLFMLNNFTLRGKIRDGDLDMLITRPVSLQFLVTLRQADLVLFFTDAIGGAVIVVIAWVRLAIPLTLYTLGGYVLFVALSTVVAYCLFLLPQILSFWFVNTSAIAEITDSFWDFNNMPMDIYNRYIQQVGVFILPIFVITNFPPLFVLHRMPTPYLAWAFVLPILLLTFVRLLWSRGLRQYSSASS